MTSPPILNSAQLEKILGSQSDDIKLRMEELLPFVSVQILNFLNKNYLKFFNAEAVKDSSVLTLATRDIVNLKKGDIMEGPGFLEDSNAPELTKVEPQDGKVTLSAPCGVTGKGIYFFRTAPMGMKIPVSQAIRFAALDHSDAGLSSKRIGPVSVSYSSTAQIGESGFPAFIEKGLLQYKRPRFI